jgi:general secretion pathway protein B
MSYILDALKKAEKERQRGTVPDVLTVQETSTWKTKNHRLLLYISLSLLLINVSVFILWTTFSPVKIQGLAPKTTAEKHSELKIVIDDKVSAPKQNQNAISIQVEQNAHLQKKADKTSQQSQSKNIVSDISQNNTDKSIKDKRIFDFDELPASVRQGIPSMSMSVHYYSDIPSSRIININGRTLKEGQELAAGLRLEEITQEGAIFSYQDSLFRIEQNK